MDSNFLFESPSVARGRRSGISRQWFITSQNRQWRQVGGMHLCSSFPLFFLETRGRLDNQTPSPAPAWEGWGRWNESHPLGTKFLQHLWSPNESPNIPRSWIRSAPGAASPDPAIGGTRAEAANKAKAWFDLPPVVIFLLLFSSSHSGNERGMYENPGSAWCPTAWHSKSVRKGEKSTSVAKSLQKWPCKSKRSLIPSSWRHFPVEEIPWATPKEELPVESGKRIQPEGEKLFLLLCQKSIAQIKDWIGLDWIGFVQLWRCCLLFREARLKFNTCQISLSHLEMVIGEFGGKEITPFLCHCPHLFSSCRKSERMVCFQWETFGDQSPPNEYLYLFDCSFLVKSFLWFTSLKIETDLFYSSHVWLGNISLSHESVGGRGRMLFQFWILIILQGKTLLWILPLVKCVCPTSGSFLCCALSSV